MNKEYPIRVVTKITGLSADQIRKWEERYSILNITRSSKGSRRFTDKDLELLQLMLEAKRLGFSLQEIGELNLGELRVMLNDFQGNLSKVSYPELEQLSSSTREYFDTCIDSLKEYNITKMEKAIYDVAMELGAVYVIHKFMVPFIKHVGRLWKNNKISKSQERFANAVIRNYLENYRASFKGFNSENPTALIATPKGQKAELGCLVNSCLSVASGWNNIYLGTDLSAEDLVQAVVSSKSSCLILSVLYPLDDQSLRNQLLKIRAGIGENVEIVINGKKSNVYSETYKTINAKVVHDLFSMPSLLEDVRMSVLS
ncbi:MAG: MerR family transcriptional regulator [Thermodesulfobacteriota bacterium]|nr:MerR family transcriptional regulator [Deltaproteobacteria bacterium TMED58]RZP16312.1 MAG: MerR family transcriptional regulator [Candidatus Dadabacteria bacterium]|tara:strand:+ start:89609 stop:90550 length:942 start_codon:yes stop_codon:yes gene_type:complete